ncbi:hypothetical protein P879_10684 [Paragonimus westermani]|uniref:Uncharacterized protein n=1 Tax=Paragonimus westermani TaxID=34504 RepID=A0A8T0D8H9_9TREM|nr:hypothetical protein P879_10684 [Paragonimus westermani]
MAHLRTYNMKVLVGNWWEERIYKDEEQKSDAYEASKLSKLSKVLISLSQCDCNMKCTPASFDGYARTGDKIQILNPGISSYYEKMGLTSPRDVYALALGITNTCTLSMLIDKRVTNIFEKLLEENVLKTVATKSVEAAQRNLFQIESPHMGNDGSLVRYGQSVMFALKLMIGLTESNAEGPPEQPLYLASDLEHLCDPVCQPGIQPLYFEYAKPSFAAQWRIEAADPKLRLEFEGRPVRLDEKVIIKHVRTNKSLALQPNCLIR